MITVITVCKNTKDNIIKTMDSVMNQTCNDIEYLIADGYSDDGTYELIEKISKEYHGKKRINIIRQKDSGIYDAMNKAIVHALGEWLIFLNAGDVFASADAIDFFCDYITYNRCDIVYGNTLLKKGLWKSRFIFMIKYECIFCHQSVFVKRDIMLNYKYNTIYKYAADYDFFLKAYLRGMKIKHMDRTVSIYDENGISAEEAETVQREYRSIQAAHRIKKNLDYYVVYNIRKIKRLTGKVIH